MGHNAVAAQERTDKHRGEAVPERGRGAGKVLESAGVAVRSAVAGMRREGTAAEGEVGEDRRQEGSSLLPEDIVPDTDAVHTGLAGYTGAEEGEAEGLDTVHIETGEGLADNFHDKDLEGSPDASSHVLDLAAAAAKPQVGTAGVVAVRMASQEGLGRDEEGSV